MIRFFLFILVIIFPIVVSGANDGGEIAGVYKMGFYSRINDNIDTVSNILRKKDLSKFPTFKGFGQLCRESNTWLDSESMDEELLREVQHGTYTRLMNIASKKKVTLGSEELTKLASCLTETYGNLGVIATEREKTLTTAGGMGLYTDGNTSNSDYDILSDIEKINSIIFTEKLDYKGTANLTPSSWQNFIKGNDPLGLWENGGNTPVIGGNPTTSALSGSTTHSTNTGQTSSGSQTLSSLGIGSYCSTGNTIGGISNLFGDDFIAGLDMTLRTGKNTGGSNYGYQDNFIGTTPESDSSSPDTTTPLVAKKDFFHKPPCNQFFCITISMTTGNQNLLGGGQTYSIESVFDRHGKIMEPIANSNLAAQKYQTNNFQLASYFKLKNIISGGGVYIENSPQKVEKRETEATDEEQKKQFEDLRRCAYASAGLSTDTKRSNILLGAGFDTNIPNQTSDTIGSTKKILGPQTPTDTTLASTCSTIIEGQAREKYYTSLSTDLTEFAVFTAAFVDQIAQALNVDTKLDHLPTR